ncbi:MAG: hypothetical protein JSR93_10515 [Verrucomicrobia bacterium]|nr:hypothetical protein [Verrucomicrobiota bacterium]
MTTYSSSQQLTGSNLGLVTGAFYSIAEANLEVSGNLTEAYNDATQTSRDYNKASCEATIERGNKAALANWAQMGQSLLSGLTDIGVAGSQKLSTGDLSQQLDTLSGEEQSLKGIQSQVQKQMVEPQDVELQELAADKTPVDPAVDTRIKEMQSGQLNPKTRDLDLDKEAIEAAPNAALKEIKGQVDDQINNNVSEKSRLMNQVQSKENQIRLVGDMIKSAFQSGSSAAQAISSKETAEAEALGKNDDFITNAQTSTMQTEQQQFQQDTSQAMSSIQALGQLSSAV